MNRPAPGITIVGEAPGPRGLSDDPLNGPTGWALAQLAGLSWDELCDRVVRANFRAAWPGPSAGSKGSAFSGTTGQWAEFWGTIETPRVILLGSRLARVARHAHRPILEWFPVGPRQVAVVPHTSGISRWYNDRRNRDRASAFLRAALATR